MSGRPPGDVVKVGVVGAGRRGHPARDTYIATHQGLTTEKVTPLLVGLLELQPWLPPWHDEPGPLFAPTPAKFRWRRASTASPTTTCAPGALSPGPEDAAHQGST